MKPVLTPRQRRLRDLMKARATINKQIQALTTGGTPPPNPPKPIDQPAPTGRIPTAPLPTDATWQQTARANQVLLEDLYQRGTRHITHREYAPGHYGKRNGNHGPQKAVA